MVSQKALQANLWKYYLAGVLQNFWFILSINILYWQSFGISYQQIGFLELLAAALVLFLQIPAGSVADLLSRKWSVFLGVLFIACANFFIGFGSSLLVFALGYGAWALGDILLSAAQPALIYDTLKELKQEQSYIKIQGRYRLITTLSLIVGTAVAPLLFSINKRLPYLLLGLLWFFSSFFVLFMVEPTKRPFSYSVVHHWQQMKQGFHYIIHHMTVRWYLAFSLLIGLPLFLYNDLVSQSYYLLIGFSLHHLAFLIPLIYGSASLVASQAHRIEKKLGEHWSLLLITVISVVSFFMMGYFHVP